VTFKQHAIEFAYSGIIIDAQQSGSGHGGGPAVFKFFTDLPI
jgi:hypothetical protein